MQWPKIDDPGFRLFDAPLERFGGVGVYVRCNRDERMNEADAAVIKAEVVALQAVLIAVFRRLASDRPELAPSLCRGFDEAEAILTGVAIKMGLEAPRESTVDALKIIEEIRSGVIRDEQVCAGA
jgi:hypothetical protein